jgi:hypothetical protein
MTFPNGDTAALAHCLKQLLTDDAKLEALRARVARTWRASPRKTWVRRISS